MNTYQRPEDDNELENVQNKRSPNEKRTKPNSSGLPVFGINKYGITRAVVHFQRKPLSAPLTVCLDHPGTALSHKHLLNLIKAALIRIPDARVTSMTFVERNVFLGTRHLDNRWLVTLNNKQAKDELLRTNILLYDKKKQFVKYDDIIVREFEQFMRYRQLKREMYPGMKDNMEDF